MPTPKPALPVPSPLAANVDELGALQKLLAPHRAAIAREEALKRIVRDGCSQNAKLEEITITGATFYAVLGEPGNKTLVDIPGLVKRIKAAAFARFATCTLDALAANVDADVYDAVTSTARIGPRSLKTFERQA